MRDVDIVNANLSRGSLDDTTDNLVNAVTDAVEKVVVLLRDHVDGASDVGGVNLGDVDIGEEAGVAAGEEDEDREDEGADGEEEGDYRCGPHVAGFGSEDPERGVDIELEFSFARGDDGAN